MKQGMKTREAYLTETKAGERLGFSIRTLQGWRMKGGGPPFLKILLAGLQVGARQHKVIFASGNGGQLIYVVSDLELVVVFTGGNYNSPKAGLPFELLGKYVVPAVLGDS